MPYPLPISCMAEPICYMNERGSVTIDAEIRDLRDITEGDLVRLSDVKVVKVEDEETDVKDLPDETCRVISEVHDRGVIRIQKEVRQALGIEGKKAKLEISGIEVVRTANELLTEVHTSIVPIDIAAFYANAATSWSRAKDFLLRENPDIEYPPSTATSTKIIGSGVVIAIVAALLLSQNGALEALAAGDRIEWAGLSIALAYGAIVMILLLPDREETVRALVE
jgi:bifunctional DNA-binding transcriptional regulator/antitoxin component of YhaV-PrlF toxin-antitoxin module